MDKKKLIISLIIVLIIILILFDILKKNKKVKNDFEIKDDTITNSEIKVEMDNITGNYTVYSSDNQVIQSGLDESMIKFYEDNPDFRP